MAESQQKKNCSLMVKRKDITRKPLRNVFLLFGCDRPGSGGNEDILQSKTAFENNKDIPKKFGSDFIVTGRKKIANRSVRRLRKDGKMIVLRKRPRSAHAQNYLSAQCKRKLSC